MKRSRVLISVSTLALLLLASACASNTEESAGTGKPSAAPNQTTASPNAALAEADDSPEETDTHVTATVRGFGTVTGRRPATSTVVPGVRLAAHDVRVTIRDGFARTEVEEEFANDTDVVLEGRYVFPLPPGASFSRLGLWVENELVLGEMVERDRAARIFQGIVDDVVRPRDPALLEWNGAAAFSLKIFPMPARKSRKVLLAYDEVLPVVHGRVKYTYPLSLGPDRAVKMDQFRLHVVIEDAGANAAETKITGHSVSLGNADGKLYADFSADKFVPEGDFLLDYPRPETDVAPVAVEGPASGGFFSVRVPVPSAPEQSIAAHRHEKVIVLDASHGITEAGYAAEAMVAKEILRRLRPEDRFAVLLCDSACVSYPERGLAANSAESIEEAHRLLQEHNVGGASNPSFALTSALQRLGEPHKGQVVYLGDGTPSAGDLKVDTIAARVRPLLNKKRAELRFIGAGPSVDEVVFQGLAETLSASYERLASADRLGRRAREIAISLDKPLLMGAKLELPAGYVDVIPSVLPALRAGEEIVVVGKLAGAAGSNHETIRLTGEIDGQPATWSRALAISSAPAENRNMLARRWATARIEQLERRPDSASTKEIVEQSIKYHVMSRHTSLIVLENDRMFAAFGIPRTQGKSNLSSAAEWGAAPRLGDSIGDAGGTGGLGLSGIGEGGGGQGFGLGLGSGEGFGSGHGRLTGSHRSASPSVRMGATSVSGRMPPEVIRRIVRQNFGRFRLCYENGLRKNPNLQGRVVVRFTIGRDGSVTNVGNGASDLPDTNVVSCVVRSFHGLSFPQPEGGVVLVTYPMTFAVDGQSSWAPRGRAASSWIGALDDQWRSATSESLTALRKTAEESRESRRAREALVSGLLVRGHFDEALREATSYVSMDPDRTMPHEILARAAAALGKTDLAVAELDTQAEIEPTIAGVHKRAARAFEAMGDELRACAHWQSAFEIYGPLDNEARDQSERCNRRLFGDRSEAVDRVATIKNHEKRIRALQDALAGSETPAYDAGRPAGERISVSLTCAAGAEACPSIVLVDPLGHVMTPVTPGRGRTGSSWIALPSAMDGTYRVFVAGGLESAQGKVEVRLDNAVKHFDVRGGQDARSVATLSVAGSW